MVDYYIYMLSYTVPELEKELKVVKERNLKKYKHWNGDIKLTNEPAIYFDVGNLLIRERHEIDREITNVLEKYKIPYEFTSAG